MAAASTFQPHKHPRDHRGRFVPRDRLGLPTLELTPGLERFIDEWADGAYPHSRVEPNCDLGGFVALCLPARGAIAFGHTEREAIDDMRSVLFDWVCFSLDLG